MTVHQAPTAFADRAAGYAAFLTAHRNKAVLRFIACGSVDDGKSTLIGRLLHDTKQIFDDQISALQRDSRKHGTQGAEVDLALLVDGLQAEREQGITIDVAYRFFSTDRRSFIVADTPGHEQYTRNMATGASTADVAVILVDARQGLTRQTRRHALLVSNLGIRRVVLAVNKMDLAGWAQGTFDGIVSGFSDFARGLNFAEVKAIPLSAKNGDNVVDAGVAAPWYTGGTLLHYLETVPVHAEALNAPFRMAVQWVNRPNSEFRGYSGRIASGRVRPGDSVTVQPSGRTSTVARIYTADGDLPEAGEDESVTLVLADQIDASRGQVIVATGAPMRVTETLDARLFWAAETDLGAGRQPVRQDRHRHGHRDRGADRLAHRPRDRQARPGRAPVGQRHRRRGPAPRPAGGGGRLRGEPRDRQPDPDRPRDHRHGGPRAGPGAEGGGRAGGDARCGDRCGDRCEARGRGRDPRPSRSPVRALRPGARRGSRLGRGPRLPHGRGGRPRVASVMTVRVAPIGRRIRPA